jgi:hypothetical protein
MQKQKLEKNFGKIKIKTIYFLKKERRKIFCNLKVSTK